MRKGISPLVAAVILIAATMSIAGILSFWANTFIEERLRESENVTAETGCLGARFVIYSGSYNNDTETLYLILENQRLFPLTLETLYIFYEGDALEEKPLDIVLGSNEIKSFNVTEVTHNFVSGRIKTNCPEVYVDFTYTEMV